MARDYISVIISPVAYYAGFYKIQNEIKQIAVLVIRENRNGGNNILENAINSTISTSNTSGYRGKCSYPGQQQPPSQPPSAPAPNCQVVLLPGSRSSGNSGSNGGGSRRGKKQYWAEIGKNSNNNN